MSRSESPLGLAFNFPLSVLSSEPHLFRPIPLELAAGNETSGKPPPVLLGRKP